jgi:pimeloyl-ACP methyl ester carboxylesterase
MGVVATAALALFAVACSASSTEPSALPGSGTAVATTVSTPPVPEVTWTACGDRLECTEVPVPLDWDDPGGPTIDLAVVRHPASKPDQRIGSILTNPGGPGDTGVGFVKNGGDDLDGFSDGRFDWVSWDPRGTYASTPVDCFRSEEDAAAFWNGVTIPMDADEGDAFMQHSEELARRCGEVMGPVLDHISTEDTVRDMDRIREVLGEEKITYAGFSYGTLIGQLYANLFPQHLRAMMLDGVVDGPAQTESAEARVTDQSNGFDAVFQLFLSTCDAAGPESCALAGHGETAADRVNGFLDELKRAPITLPPGAPLDELTYTDVLLSTYSPMRNPNLWPDYAGQLETAIAGDLTGLAEGAVAWRTPSAWAEAVKSSAINCLDGPATTEAADWRSFVDPLVAKNTMVGTVLTWWLWAPCAAGWPGTNPDRFVGPWNTETEVPILLIGTLHDPNTSYAGAEHVHEILGSSVLLTHDGYGHLSFQDHSTCIEEWRTKYLVELELPPAGTVCPADKKPFE